MATQAERKTQTPESQKPLDEKSDAQLKREAKARLKYLDPISATQLVNEVVGRQTGGFADFLRENAVVGLAIGFVLGSQLQVVVKSINDNFINTLFTLVLPDSKVLTAQTWMLHIDDRSATFGWGAIVYALVNFIFIAATIYIIFKLFRLDRLKKT